MTSRSFVNNLRIMLICIVIVRKVNTESDGGKSKKYKYVI